MATTGQGKVLWINLKGADWALMEPLLKAGKMPNLASLIGKGTFGQIFAVPPRRFPSSTVTLATGAEPYDHQIVAPIFASDETKLAIRPVGPSDWACPPVWEAAAAAGRQTIALGWPGTHPARSTNGATVVSDGFMVARGPKTQDWPEDPDSVSDPALVSQLAKERLHPKEVRGEMLRNLLGAMETIDTANDERLQYMVEALSRTFSIHRAACWMVAHRPWDFFAVHFDLLDHLSQIFLQYQAPRMGHVTNADHARYAGVVDGAYAYIDRMLAPYVRAADAVQANVVLTSDHGYLTGDLRKRPNALEGARAHLAYRDAGVFVAAGSSFQQGRRTAGFATVSVAPTILAALGCGAPSSMTGPVMQNIMTIAAPLAGVETVTVAPESGLSEEQAKLSLAYLERRDLLPLMPNDREARLETVRCSQLTRLAQCNLTANRFDVAMHQLAEARSISPSSIEVHMLMAQCCVTNADWDQAEEALDALDGLGVEIPMAIYFRGRVAIARGETEAAHRHLADAAGLVKDNAEGCKVLESIGRAYFDMQEMTEAARTFERALRINAHAPRALSGIGAIHLQKRDFEKASTCFQASLSTLQKQPLTRALLGQAFLGLGQIAEARSAFETALTMDPDLAVAKEGIAQVERKETGDAADTIPSGFSS